MNIEDTNKISSLDILDTKCNFKILELEGIDLDDDWSKLSKLKNLENNKLITDKIPVNKLRDLFNFSYHTKKINIIFKRSLKK